MSGSIPASVPLLAGLPHEDRESVLRACRRRQFGRGVTLFHEQDPGDTLHLLVAGRVAIQVGTSSGKTVKLMILHAPDAFGEQALLDPMGRRDTSAVALEATTTLALHREDFETIRRAHRSVNEHLVDVLAAQVRRLTCVLVESLHTPAEERVLRRLHEVAVGFATAGTPITVPLGQDTLATLAGTTRATVNRALRRAQATGAIEVARRRIEVRDLDLLAEVAYRSAG